MNIFKKSSYLFLFILFVGVLSPVAYSAEEKKGEFSVTVINEYEPEPSKLVYELKPGDSVEDEIFISNLSDTAQLYEVYVADAVIVTDNEINFMSKDDPGEFMPNWVTFSINEVEIDANNGALVSFTIDVPENVEFDLYKGGMIVSLPPNDEELAFARAEGGQAVVANLATVIELTITDNPKNLDKKSVEIIMERNIPWYYWVVIGFVNLLFIFFILKYNFNIFNHKKS